MDEPKESGRRGRGRRPAAEVRETVLETAGAMLFETGLTGITFEKVAARAGASKMTLYKWWPSPGALAFEAYYTAVEDTLAFADTGDIERDLTAQLHSFVGLLTAPATGHVIAQLAGASQTDPALADALAQHYTHPRRRLAVDRLTRAQRAGQIRAEVDPQVVVDQLWGACYHRLLLPDEPLDTAFADALIDNLLRGIRG
ncbi:TetR-like C-terminal domain-containing protein [Streptomyces sp. NBC_01022]|uniref:TetR-like C-terminal domain-containing protein n=1 Tax=Streptomyces sp. NBC_01022 TaxID=2903723 RepID=UPI002DD8EB10|nr:TetR-like C-terminal domain-containing protein [Streptomyces sp. NBC_01022]WRZ83497.1 TetR/AcrR family transcriptional regulator C-terminal ligand-binding domain-containing protein [Streptomyces sp. NBC_01022]